MKIYTKGGDRGETSLVTGRRVRKDDALIEAYGTVDELNAFCGLLVTATDHEVIVGELGFVQNCLFNIGSILARDNADIKDFPVITQTHTEHLERAIDRHNSVLKPLRNFILPSGSKAIALSHICRTITRRAERKVVALEADTEDIGLVLIFLNRLSDYFFILARSFARIEGVEEVPWNAQPQEL